jgi:hypothetical protein
MTQLCEETMSQRKKDEQLRNRKTGMGAMVAYMVLALCFIDIVVSAGGSGRLEFQSSGFCATKLERANTQSHAPKLDVLSTNFQRIASTQQNPGKFNDYRF